MIDKSMDALAWLRKQLETDDNDLLREMVRSFAEGLMGAEADVLCGAPYGEASPERTNRRNGYRTRRCDGAHRNSPELLIEVPHPGVGCVRLVVVSFGSVFAGSCLV